MDAFGTSISLALQYGVSLITLVDKFRHARFEPSGMTSNRDIPFAKSLVDYIFCWLGCQFVPGYADKNLPDRRPATSKPNHSPAVPQARQEKAERQTQGIPEAQKYSTEDKASVTPEVQSITGGTAPHSAFIEKPSGSAATDAEVPQTEESPKRTTRRKKSAKSTD